MSSPVISPTTYCNYKAKVANIQTELSARQTLLVFGLHEAACLTTCSQKGLGGSQQIAQCQLLQDKTGEMLFAYHLSFCKGMEDARNTLQSVESLHVSHDCCSQHVQLPAGIIGTDVR